MTNGSLSGLPAPSDEDVSRADKIISIEGIDLESVRQSATSWRNAGLVSTGLAAASAILSGPSTLQGLPEPAKALVFWILVASGIALITSIALSVRASIGWPSPVRATRAGSYVEWQQREARVGSRLVRLSMVATLLAAILGATAAAIIFAVPPADKDVLVLETIGGTSYCSVSVRVGPSYATIEFRDMNVRVAIDDIQSISQASQCK